MPGVDADALYDRGSFEMDQRLGDDVSPKILNVSAADIEAWSLGDADPFESELYKRLFEASEEVSRQGKKSVSINIRVMSEE